MPDPTDTPNYCDMAENTGTGYRGGPCTELDLLEANSNSLQSALHTQRGGAFGSGNCDRNGANPDPNPDPNPYPNPNSHPNSNPNPNPNLNLNP